MSFWIRPVLRLQRVHHRATEITTQDVRRWMSHSADAARALLGVRCGANPAELEQAYLESIKRIKETAPSPLIAVHVAELSQALQVRLFPTTSLQCPPMNLTAVKTPTMLSGDVFWRRF